MANANEASFFAVADERFFVGVACVVNSLRLTGNAGEIVVLDNGFSAAQRERLAPHVSLIDLPPGEIPSGYLLKPFPHLLEPRGTIALIDSDMMVTRNLQPIIEQAAAGKICAFADIPDQRHRHLPEWEQVFGLARPPREQHYVNAGFLAFSTEHHPDLLGRYWALCSKIPADALFAVGADYEQPFWGGDQDALNALLMSEVDAEAVVELPEQEGPSPRWLADVRVEDPTTLRCTLDGHSPYVLHYWGRPKPWQRQSWLRVERDAYVELMPRVLFGDDCPIRVDPDEVPPWMRPGRGPIAARTALGAVNRTARRGLDRIPTGVRSRLARAARRLAG